MRPMKRHRYISDNTMKCPHCKKTKTVRSFYDKTSFIVNDNCNVCTKKIQEIEITKIVLGILTKNNI